MGDPRQLARRGYVETGFITMLSDRGILNCEMLGKRKPIGRQGTPGEIGECALFLASAAASFVTEKVLILERG